MKGTKAKVWTLVASLMLPGFFAWSCGGTAVRTIRDEAVQGAADAVEVTIFDLVLDALTPPQDDDEADE